MSAEGSGRGAVGAGGRGDAGSGRPAASAMPGFYRLGRGERVRMAAALAGLSEADAAALADPAGGLDFGRADRMVENAIGTMAVPLGVATNFVINGRDVLVPMAIEEPSVIAAASKGAKAARLLGGFRAEAGPQVCTGQIQVVYGGAGGDVPPPLADARRRIDGSAAEMLAAANACSSTLSRSGRGARTVTCRMVGGPGLEEGEGGGDGGPGPEGPAMLLVELHVDVGDAMGANVTNSMCEAAAPIVERAVGGRALLRILSNYSTVRTARATAVFDAEAVGGPGVVDSMLLAYRLARDDVHRAVTHNKGIMNGCAAVACATGQDVRAIEAAAHAYAARSGAYRSLSEWSRDGDGNLVGSLEMPMQVGTVGGVAGVHPTARLCIRMLGAGSSAELARCIVSAGLAQNYSAMRALCTEGIQRGHMRLHARNLAAAAVAACAGGGAGIDADEIARTMVSEGRVSAERARQLADAAAASAGAAG